MYLPAHFREERREVLHAFIEQHPLGTLVTTAGGRPDANHLPMLLDPTVAPHGALRGHVARANPLWRAVGEGAEVLVIFGGAEAYISPAWYPSKRTDGRVVPTWNYAVVHARGRIQFFDDAVRLHALVSALTERHETGRPEPWAVADAPATYIDSMLKAIVGFEIGLSELEGKFKASQNRSAADRESVRAVLSGTHDAADCSELVRDPPGAQPAQP